MMRCTSGQGENPTHLSEFVLIWLGSLEPPCVSSLSSKKHCCVKGHHYYWGVGGENTFSLLKSFSHLYSHTKKCIVRMHCKSLWVKASAKCTHVNVFPCFHRRLHGNTAQMYMSPLFTKMKPPLLSYFLSLRRISFCRFNLSILTIDQILLQILLSKQLFL